MSILATQLAHVLSLSPRALERRAVAEGWPALSIKPLRFALAELPETVRAAVRQAQAQGLHLETPLALPGMQTSSLAIRQQDVPAELPVSERSKRKALDRHRLGEAFQEALDNAPRGDKAQAAKAFVLAYNSGVVFPEIHARVGRVSEASLRLWSKTYRRSEGDYLAFCPTPRQIGLSLSMEYREVILRCWLHPSRPSIRLAWRAACTALGIKDAQHTKDAQESKDAEKAALSYDVCYRFIKRFEERNYDLVLLARFGEKALKDKALPYITRDDSVLRVGDVVVADGHVLNFTVRHPRTGKPARLMLVMMYDWASRYPVGWQIMPTESTIAVAGALRMACQTLGRPPLHLLLDNGKAFKAKVFTRTSPDFQDFAGLFGRLGILVHFAAPYNARAKVIERFFWTLQTQFEPLVPSYCGSSIEAKPAHLMRNEEFHRRWHEARTNNWVPTVREAAHMLDAYIQWYARTPHDGLDGMTPLEVFEAGLPEPTPDMAWLDREFLWREERTPANCRVQLYGVDYESDALMGIKVPVTVYYNTADMTRVEIALDGRSLGEALPVQAVHPLVAMLEDGDAALSDLKEALARQRGMAKKAKADLAEALGETGRDLAEVLDWKPTMAVAAVKPKALPAGQVAAQPIPATSPEETARLRSLAVAAQQDQQSRAEPASDRPAFFVSDLARYEWIFRAQAAGKAVSADDAAWRAEFEQSNAFNPYRQRFADLAQVLARKDKQRAAA
ncbi:DDE-type integrase/transposase/recombinase [Megalodesulfovibrio gigas]|uniref:Putative integrase catalytic region n=1 Tax=Megalodesulfovibrio gigas (strain ATCC 19364 / DSM 1382 / NCIMB 9332 / VKM B-1759) TaxID=1121448 RepID=T2GCY0_MEGG1|nr:DDE-type integrase/transposase/recombinase [Megalodesulfovibrio gigas]AGW14143.1 putative integrase catalytic region [Megalodesulfovibrio gigas DSM 1382 = ATCC 19364]